MNYLCSERLIRDETLPPFIERDIGDLADFIAGLSRPNRLGADARIAAFAEHSASLLR